MHWAYHGGYHGRGFCSCLSTFQGFTSQFRVQTFFHFLRVVRLRLQLNLGGKNRMGPPEILNPDIRYSDSYKSGLIVIPWRIVWTSCFFVRRAEQCARFNNNNFHIHGVPSDVKWVPKYGTGEEKCRRCRWVGLVVFTARQCFRRSAKRQYWRGWAL